MSDTQHQQAQAAKKAYLHSLKAYFSQFDDQVDSPDVSGLLDALKPVICQEAFALLGPKKYVVAEQLGINRGVLSRYLARPLPTPDDVA